MPSNTEKQRKFIFYKRGLYKNKHNTPSNWKWIWDKGWNELKESKFDQLYNFILEEYK